MSLYFPLSTSCSDRKCSGPSLYAHARPNLSIKDPHSPSASRAAEAIAACQGLAGLTSSREAAEGHSLCSELVGAHGDAVHELHGAPEPVELHALVHVHHSVCRGRPAPDGVLQVAPNSRQDHLEHGQPAAQTLLGQQVTLPGDGYLLRRGRTIGETEVKWQYRWVLWLDFILPSLPGSFKVHTHPMRGPSLPLLAAPRALPTREYSSLRGKKA